MTLALVFSILSPLEHAVRWLLFRFHDNIGLSWAWSIVATTVAVRILLVPLTVRQIHSMQSLQKHAPEMKEIQRKYKGDREKLNQELMKFYRENHINPAASCLPLVAQIPVFFALYLVLRHFDRYVTAGADLSWLHFVPSISAKANSHWSGYVLLAVYAGSQVLSSYFMSTTMDKAQRVILMVFPVLFITVVAHFPTGLVLYWVTTNLWTVGQGLITRRLMPKTPLPTFSPRRTPKPSSAPAPKPAPAAVADGKTAPKPRPQSRQTPRRVKRKKGGPRR